MEQEYKRARDDSRELTLMLEKKNQDLLEKQDTEVYLATLKERNRIAREIHDNVGHMLSRSILMVGALKTVNQAENLKVPMEQLDQTLNEAMTNVRQSVHDLHDESVNLKEVMESLAEEFRFCPVQLTYDMGYDIPKEIKYSFIAITKEALNNVMRHSNANEVKILAREHPGLYQLIIEDNGTSDERIRPNGEREEYAEKESAGKTGNTRKTENTECSGIGIKNMKKRVRMLGGTMQIQKETGFRIFITVPKNEGKKMKIVIVDDDILVSSALKTILEAGGEVEVTGTGQDGKDAVRLYDELLPDVLLMDIRMKDMNGLDAAEQILKRHTDAKILFAYHVFR